MTTPTIGILGGMGPRATVLFEQRLLAQCSGSDQQLPSIISVNNSQIPDRSSFVTAQGEDPLNELVASARILLNVGVNIVCIPCNTAHHPSILNRLLARVPLPIIDMPGATIAAAESRGYERLLVLGTVGTKTGQLFDQRTTSSRCIYPNDDEQQLISALIAMLKQGNRPTAQTQTALARVIARQRPDAIILGCTELSLLPASFCGNIPVLDTLDILATQCVNICNIISREENTHDTRPIHAVGTHA